MQELDTLAARRMKTHDFNPRCRGGDRSAERVLFVLAARQKYTTGPQTLLCRIRF